LAKISLLFWALEESIAPLVFEEFGAGIIFLSSVVDALNHLKNQLAHHARIGNFHFWINLEPIAPTSGYYEENPSPGLSLLLWLEVVATRFDIDVRGKLFRLGGLLECPSPSFSAMRAPQVSLESPPLGWSRGNLKN